MIWLLLSIITNTALILILKSFRKLEVNTLQAIVVNYFTAGTLGFALCGMPVSITEIPQQEWAWVPPVLGVLFISIFLLLAKAAQTIGVSVATVANKMSLVIPVLAAIIFYHESAGGLKILGLIIAILSVYLTSLPSQKEITDKKPSFLKYFWMPTVIFLGSGVLDALINHARMNLVPDTHLPLFLSLCFYCAGIIGITVILIRRIKLGEKFERKSLLAGICLGIPNYFSIYGITRALGSNLMESSALFPVNNMGIVALSAISALLIFKEKFSITNWAGILLSIAAIALIAFS
ncbi:MAG: EamA family transporter [Bacteroidia bacterium]